MSHGDSSCMSAPPQFCASCSSQSSCWMAYSFVEQGSVVWPADMTAHCVYTTFTDACCTPLDPPCSACVSDVGVSAAAACITACVVIGACGCVFLCHQVTNPPIDPLREGLVMSLEMRLGGRGNLLQPSSNTYRQVSAQLFPGRKSGHIR